MSDLFRTERAAELRRLLAEQRALLDDLLEGQREIGRLLGSSRGECAGLTTKLGGLATELDGLGRSMDCGFAELNNRIEQVTQLVQKLVDKKLPAQLNSPASRSINRPSCQVPSAPRS